MRFAEKRLKTNEELMALIKKYWLTFVWPWLWTVCMFAVGCFLAFPLIEWGKTGGAILILIILVACVFLVRVLVMSKFNIMIITDERIIRIRQSGLWERSETEIELNEVNEVLYRMKGFWQTMFGYGSILIRVKGDKQKSLIFNGVRKPDKAQQLILGIKKTIRMSESENNIV